MCNVVMGGYLRNCVVDFASFWQAYWYGPIYFMCKISTRSAKGVSSQRISCFLCKQKFPWKPTALRLYRARPYLPAKYGVCTVIKGRVDPGQQEVLKECTLLFHFLNGPNELTQTEVECTCSVPAVPCSVHCRYTAPYAVYLQYRLLIHCWHTADCSVHCAYTACTL